MLVFTCELCSRYGFRNCVGKDYMNSTACQSRAVVACVLRLCFDFSGLDTSLTTASLASTTTTSIELQTMFCTSRSLTDASGINDTRRSGQVCGQAELRRVCMTVERY